METVFDLFELVNIQFSLALNSLGPEGVKSLGQSLSECVGVSVPSLPYIHIDCNLSILYPT